MVICDVCSWNFDGIVRVGGCDFALLSLRVAEFLETRVHVVLVSVYWKHICMVWRLKGWR